MASPNETAILRYVLEMKQANKYHLARVLGISPNYSGCMLGGLHRRGLLELGQADGSKHDVYKLTPDGAEELLEVLGMLRLRESKRAEKAAQNIERIDKRTARCQAFMTRQGLIPQEAMAGAL
jgi:Mn-dependent DtxR family transcriptional regulator